MLDVIDDLPGDQLELDAYLDDFEAHFSTLRGLRVWKIERKQEFRQPESRSWTAFSQGRWADAVRTVFAWSYRALPEESARLFRFLGLHPGLRHPCGRPAGGHHGQTCAAATGHPGRGTPAGADRP